MPRVATALGTVWGTEAVPGIGAELVSGRVLRVGAVLESRTVPGAGDVPEIGAEPGSRMVLEPAMVS